MGQLGDLSPQGSVAIGILVGLLSTSIQSLGLTLQRKSHLLEDDKADTETRRPPYKRRRWQLGMLMFVVSNLVGSTIQITTLPLPVLSTLQASGLVFNTAFATLLLKEPFTRFSIIGTVLTCSGAALIAVFGSVAEPAHNLQQLLNLFTRAQFIMWMVGSMLIAGATLVFSHVLKVYSSHHHMSRHLQKRERSGSRPVSRSGSNPDLHLRRVSITAQLPRALQIRVGRLRFYRGLSYALISGILSAHSLLMAKSAVELIVRTIVDHDNQFTRFQSWIIVLVLLFFALTQLYYLNLGLRLCSTSVLYPFVFCIYNIVAILDGLIYFRQAQRLGALHGGLIALGTLVLLAGVLALSWRLDDTAPVEPAASAMPQTPLTPGMGLVRSSEDDEQGSLLPTSRSRESLIGERTPLLFRRARGHTVGGQLETPVSATRDIWAALDDEEDDAHDFLTALHGSPSLELSRSSLEVPKKKRRRGSTATPNHSNSDLRDVSPSTVRQHTLPWRSRTLQPYDFRQRGGSPLNPRNRLSMTAKESREGGNPGEMGKNTTDQDDDHDDDNHSDNDHISGVSPAVSGYHKTSSRGRRGVHWQNSLQDRASSASTQIPAETTELEANIDSEQRRHHQPFPRFNDDDDDVNNDGDDGGGDVPTQAKDPG